MKDAIIFMILGFLAGFCFAMEMVQDHHACPPDHRHSISYLTPGKCP